MTEREPDQALEDSVDEFDERLDKLDDQIGEAKDKAQAARPEDSEQDDDGPASEEFPLHFDDTGQDPEA
jgi:hypothetical protein